MVFKKSDLISRFEAQIVAEYVESIVSIDENIDPNYKAIIDELIRLLRSPVFSLRITQSIRKTLSFVFEDEEEFILFSDFVRKNYSIVDPNKIRKELIYDEKINFS